MVRTGWIDAGLFIHQQHRQTARSRSEIALVSRSSSRHGARGGEHLLAVDDPVVPSRVDRVLQAKT
jgi:hypothetical protein